MINSSNNFSDENSSPERSASNVNSDSSVSKSSPKGSRRSRNNNNSLSRNNFNNLNTKNYFLSEIPNVFEQLDFFQWSKEYYDRSLDYSISISNNFKDLALQANIFAEDFCTHNLGRLENDIRGRDQLAIKVYECYIYSYFKAYFFGTNSQSGYTSNNKGNAFLGHSIFFHFLRHRTFNMRTENGIHVTLRINNSVYDSSDLFLEEAISTFSFLGNCIQGVDYRGNSSFYSSYYENFLNKINDMISREHLDKSTSALNSIKIYQLDDNVTAKNISKECFPFLNYLRTPDEKNIVFVSHRNDKAIENRCYSLSNSLLLKLDSESCSDHNMAFFKKFPCNPREYSDYTCAKHFYIQDVFAVTNLVCRNVSTNLVEKTFLGRTKNNSSDPGSGGSDPFPK